MPISTKIIYYKYLMKRWGIVYCVDNIVAIYCNVLLPEANIAIIAICCIPRLQYIDNILF